MRQRSLNQAGSLTTIFLRTLEYYEGMLFLTTNRLTDFDPAMMSRVHVALQYPALGRDARRVIWESFLQRAPKGEVKLSCEELDNLVARKLNGREVIFFRNKIPLSDFYLDKKRFSISIRLGIRQ
jgi:hypothetical protein